MEKREFQTESKRLLDMMINSVYTHKEIFLRELISNASDAIDKLYYQALVKEDIEFTPEDYKIEIKPNPETRTLLIRDNGIGMTAKELEENLGVIARSGSYVFKQGSDSKENVDIIGQFGVGFYSAFMVAEKVTVISRAVGTQEAFKWESSAVDGYTIEPWNKAETGTDIILSIKPDTEEEKYGSFLDTAYLESLIKKYSDFIRYPIQMEVTSYRSDPEKEEHVQPYKEVKTINSRVPIWRKQKSELTDDAYNDFYQEKHYGFDKPLRHMHVSVDGVVSYNAILYIPTEMPFNFYTREYEKGLELYVNGVLVMNKCPDLLPDFYAFVKGIVDSPDLSLNISREVLQHDRQLQLIARNLQTKITRELEDLLKNDRTTYETFFNKFGRQFKFGIYSDFGSNKELLQDLLLFYSGNTRKMITLQEYVDAMLEEQEVIYYAAGESPEKIAALPQNEAIMAAGFDVLFLTEDIDEFALRMMDTYGGYKFKSVSSDDLRVDAESEEKAARAAMENADLLQAMKEILKDKVKDVKISVRLKKYPSCLLNAGEISLEMEKILNAVPLNGETIKADKILEINADHPAFAELQASFKTDKQRFSSLVDLLYYQGLIVEGISVEDPEAFINSMWSLI